MHIGHIFADRFELERYAGAGSMGTVYRARDRFTGRPVALKILHAKGRMDEPRFVREAEALARLTHPAIVRFIAHGTASTAGTAGTATDNVSYIATEWLDGESLAARLERKPLTLVESLTLGARVAEALGEAHRAGVVHRDIKPSNLLLSRARVEDVKILDFGVASLAGAAPLPVDAGGVIGTPGYISPEQARGEEVDGRADLFSLGCLLFKCLTGRGPFDADEVMASLAKLALGPAPRLSTVFPDAPAKLDELLARMLAQSRSERPADAEEITRALAEIDLPDRTSLVPPPLRGQPSLTTTERPVLCLVFVKPSREAEAAEARAAEARAAEGSPDAAAPALRAALAAHGSHLASLTDRSLLLTVPSAGAFTDQAAHAARAALAMKALDPGAKLAVVAGRSDTSAQVPISGLIDHGADLLQRAAPGMIRLDEVIGGLVARMFDLGSDGDGLYLVGERTQEEPPNADRQITQEDADKTRPRPRAKSKRTLLGQVTPFLGRDRELNLLQTIFEEVATEKVARAVLITAPAGIGKSRLRLEFLSWIREHHRGTTEIWSGRGDPMRAGSAFGLLAPMIRVLTGARVDEPIEVRRKKLLERMGRKLSGRDQARVAMFLGEIAGVPFPDDESIELDAARKDATLMGDQMRRAFEDLVAAEAALGPRVFTLEDIHWSDRASLQFFDHMLRTLEDRPLLVLAVGRPTVFERFPALWADRPVTSIKLTNLARKASTRLVEQVLGNTVPEETVTRIVTLAGGDAFYLEELIRAVAEGKGSELPETVLAMVQERLDGLDIESRRILRAASVFGRAFWSGGVAALLGGEAPAETIADRLHDLELRELILHQPVSRFSDQDEYIFRQDLVREASYAMLTDADRTLGHRLAAEWLERIGELEAGLLGEHFERGGEPGRALTWYRRAAEQALEGDDVGEALRWAERAWRGAPPAQGADTATREELARLHRVQSEAHRLRGELALAEPHARDAQRLLPWGSELWFVAALEVVEVWGSLGRAEPLIVLSEEFCNLWTPEASSAQIIATARAAVFLVYRGKYALVDDLLARLDTARHAAADPKARAGILLARAVRALILGDSGRQLELIAEAVEQFAAAGDRRNACITRVPLGFSHNEIGGWEEAERHLREALAVAERMGLPTVAAYAQHNLGFTLARRGALEEARAVESEAVQCCTAFGSVRLAAGSRAYLAIILAELGELALAEQEATGAVEGRMDTPPSLAYALAIRARIRLAQERTADALADAQRAAQLLRDLGGIDEGESLVRLAHAEALHAAGEVAAARVAIAEARARLLERTEKFTVEKLKVQFLENVPEHKRTLVLAAAWETRGAAAG